MITALLRSLGTGLAGLFVRKTITADAVTGEESTTRQPTTFGKGAALVLGAALLWHFLLWPILDYHFPEYGFPAIDAALLSVLAGMGW